MRRRPYAVVLLDEIEKAHPDVFNVLLQVLDDGRLTDGQGRTVDFTNAVLIMTSNLQGDPIDFFKPEFVNRIDEIVALPAARPRATSRRSSTSSSESLARAARRPPPRARGLPGGQGAARRARLRPGLRRPAAASGSIQRELGDPLALALLEGRYRDGDTVHVDVEDGGRPLTRIG